MSAGLLLEIQRAIIVCPDCGQRYDPAKAAAVVRVRTYSGRSVKPGRVEAQDVRTAAHRTGRHHRAHETVTRRALDGWSLVEDEYALGAKRFGVTVEAEKIDSATTLRLVRKWDLDCLTTECDNDTLRALGERIWRASMTVRVDRPWWRAYLHELGADADEIARGIVVNTKNRGDLFFARPRRTVAPLLAPTLRGLT